MTTPTQGLKVFFGCDRDVLHRMQATANLDRALVTAPTDRAVVELISETLTARLRNSSWLIRAPMMGIYETRGLPTDSSRRFIVSRIQWSAEAGMAHVSGTGEGPSTAEIGTSKLRITTDSQTSQRSTENLATTCSESLTSPVIASLINLQCVLTCASKNQRPRIDAEI